MMEPWPTTRRAVPRPTWWTPEAVLERLQNGVRPGELCEAASNELAGAVRPVTLRADISTWSGSYTWGEQFTAALALWKRGQAGKFTLSKDWHDDFLVALQANNGNIPPACTDVGVGEELVYAFCDKRNKCYDADFAEKVRILEGARYSRIRENFLNQAENDTSPDGGKLAAKALESGLPAFHGSKQQVEVTAQVNVDHVLRLSPEVVAAAQARMRTMLSGRNGNNDIAKPDDVVDAEVVTQETL